MVTLFVKVISCFYVLACADAASDISLYYDVHFPLCYRMKSTLPKLKKSNATFGQLDIRVGKILEVERHPKDDMLYIEKVYFAEDRAPRTIVSGVTTIPIEKVKYALTVFILNLPLYTVSNVMTEGMILVANDGRKMELIKPPKGAAPGDIVYVDGFKYDPEPYLTELTYNYVFHKLKIDHVQRATYDGIPWNVSGKGWATVEKAEPCNIV